MISITLSISVDLMLSHIISYYLMFYYLIVLYLFFLKTVHAHLFICMIRYLINRINTCICLFCYVVLKQRLNKYMERCF